MDHMEVDQANVHQKEKLKSHARDLEENDATNDVPSKKNKELVELVLPAKKPHAVHIWGDPFRLRTSEKRTLHVLEMFINDVEKELEDCDQAFNSFCSYVAKFEDMDKSNTGDILPDFNNSRGETKADLDLAKRMLSDLKVFMKDFRNKYEAIKSILLTVRDKAEKFAEKIKFFAEMPNVLQFLKDERLYAAFMEENKRLYEPSMPLDSDLDLDSDSDLYDSTTVASEVDSGAVASEVDCGELSVWDIRFVHSHVARMKGTSIKTLLAGIGDNMTKEQKDEMEVPYQTSKREVILSRDEYGKALVDIEELREMYIFGVDEHVRVLESQMEAIDVWLSVMHQQVELLNKGHSFLQEDRLKLGFLRDTWEGIRGSTYSTFRDLRNDCRIPADLGERDRDDYRETELQKRQSEGSEKLGGKVGAEHQKDSHFTDDFSGRRTKKIMV